MWRLFPLFIAALTMYSCGGVQRPPRDIMYCPPPSPIPCVPTLYDARLDPPVIKGYAYSTYAVRGASLFDHEWSIAFVQTGTLLLNKESEKRGRLFNATWVQFDSITVGTECSISEMGDIGPASCGTNSLITVYAYGKPEADADIMLYDNRGISMPLGLDQSGTWDAQPALNPSGSVVFFSSDRSGGFGGCDIWFSVKTGDSEWSAPVNAGPAINTPCDELTPFVSTDGKRLLFASRGHQSLGGYDIFRSEIRSEPQAGMIVGTDGNVFGEVQNLGSTVNTKADELSPSGMTGEDELLYFSSNRRSTFDFDMYVRRREPRSVRTLAAELPIIQNGLRATMPDPVEIRGRVTDELQRGIANAEVSARDTERDSIVARTVTDTVGEYSLRVQSDRPLQIVAQSSRGFFDVQPFNPSDTSRKSLAFTIPEILELRINFPSDEDKVPYEMVLDSNGRETDQRWGRALDRIAENLKKFTGATTLVQLVGHTDQNGSAAYNEALGKRRVNFVVDELVQRGLPASIFRARSAGEREPLNRRLGEDTAEYDKRNRRVELVKVSR